MDPPLLAPTPCCCCPRYGDSNELWNSLDGIFACVVWDERTGYFCVARDPIGICSLYYGRGADGSFWIASEMKSLQTKCVSIDCFPPVGGRAAGARGGVVGQGGVGWGVGGPGIGWGGVGWGLVVGRRG